MPIISIAGKINSGKDTVGRIIQYLTCKVEPKFTLEELFPNYSQELEIYSDWKIKKFATKLKDIVCLLIGCNREQLEDQDFKNKELGEEWWYYQCRHNVPPYEGISCNRNRPESKDNAFKRRADLSRIHNVSDSNYRVDLIKPSVRWMLQNMGTEAIRSCVHPNAWVNALFADYTPSYTFWNIGDLVNKQCQESQVGENTKPIYPNWVITDLRFPNEFEAVKERKGICIKVTRPTSETIVLGDNTVGVARGPLTNEPELLSNHASETSLDHIPDSDWDYVIQNDGSITDLIEKVREILLRENIL